MSHKPYSFILMTKVHEDTVIVSHFVGELVVFEGFKILLKLESEHIGFDDIQVDVNAIDFL